MVNLSFIGSELRFCCFLQQFFLNSYALKSFKMVIESLSMSPPNDNVP